MKREEFLEKFISEGIVKKEEETQLKETFPQLPYYPEFEYEFEYVKNKGCFLHFIIFKKDEKTWDISGYDFNEELDPGMLKATIENLIEDGFIEWLT